MLELTDLSLYQGKCENTPLHIPIGLEAVIQCIQQLEVCFVVWTPCSNDFYHKYPRF